MPSAAPAPQMRDETAGRNRRQHELCTVAVSRIQGWLKHSGKQLSDLFAKIDTDGSGDFDVSEFRAVLYSAEQVCLSCHPSKCLFCRATHPTAIR